MSKRNGRRILALLAAMAMVITACGGGTETPDPATDSGDTGSDTGDDAASDDAVVVIPAGEKIQIRSLEAISGDVAFLGTPNQRATQMAIADYGDIQGFEVDLGTPLDDLCSADGGQAAAQTIVADKNVVGVIGTSCSGAAGAALPLLSEAGMVLVSASNTNPRLTQSPFGTAGEAYLAGYYRTAHNDLYQGAAVADFVFNELGLTKAGAIHDGDPYTDGLATAFKEAYEALGGEVVIYTSVNKGDTDMVPVLTEVAAAGPEVVFMPIFPPEVNFIAQQVGGVSGWEDVVLFSADGASVAGFMEIKESEGFYFSGPNLQFGTNANEITGATASDVLSRYTEEFGEAPSAGFWAHAYDATTMLLKAIDTVAVVGDDGSLTIDRAALREALSAASFQGLIGTITCDAFGDCGAQEIQIILHTDSSVTDQTTIEPVKIIKP
jgi:branched-chain amino acid transport system substrate-binding protein